MQQPAAAQTGGVALETPVRPARGVRDAAVAVWITVGAMVVFAAAWGLLNVLVFGGFFGAIVFSDDEVYREFARQVATGLVPYRDFPLEYPPGALPAFVVPWLAGGSDPDSYALAFEQLMLDCGPSSPTLGFPAPVGPEPCPMPPQDGGRLHSSSQSQQAWPEPRHPDH